MSRAYFFSNMYISGIHTGIQAGHAMDQIWLKYTEKPCAQLNTLRTFSKRHKTFIIVNGGDHSMLTDLFKFMKCPHNPYPFQQFREPGLNDAITSVGIVISASLYNPVATKLGKLLNSTTLSKGEQAWVDTQREQYTKWEQEFLRRKALCNLAS